jgi:hypothetical protein
MGFGTRTNGQPAIRQGISIIFSRARLPVPAVRQLVIPGRAKREPGIPV